MAALKHDWTTIHELHQQGWGWPAIARHVGYTGAVDSLRGQYSVWRRRNGIPSTDSRPDNTSAEQSAGTIGGSGESVEALLTADQIQRITTLDDLLTLFKVDTDRYEVRDFRVNKWEQHSVKKGIVPLYQVRANLVRKIEDQVEAAREMVQQMIADAAVHMPAYPDLSRLRAPVSGEPVLFELAIMDPHIGMLAWGSEVGGTNYDSKIAVQDYRQAVEYLLGWAEKYPVERILYLVGNDLLHADSTLMNVKGGGKGGTTAGGTAQDVDTRLAKAFTVARQAVVEGIDLARTIAPVTVMVVPGNHDTQQMYRMGEVLAAWYRHDPEVEVIYGPNKRKYWGWGRNAWMFTHGEEYHRKRDNLVTIFATECPAELWVGSTHREIHTGHNHAAFAGQYVPTSELTETRSIRTRSLPALTSSDSWHHEEGFKHQRAATALVYRQSGGLVGYHEFHLD